jgi:Amt family ammonium transporter
MNATCFTPTNRSIQPSQHTYELPEQDFQDLLPAPPIDCDRLLEQCVGNLDFALTLLDEFEKTSHSRLAAFDAALAAGNHTSIASRAHALRGVAGILTADALVEICSNLESLCKERDWNRTRDLIQQLHHEVQRTIDFIPTIRP